MSTPLAVEVIAVCGPTASGKTAVAESVADRLGTEVVSADALQVYRGLSILTDHPARPTRLVGVRRLDQTMSVGEYAPLAQAAIDELVDAFGVAVVAGGSGLYLRAALAELQVPPPPAPGARSRIEGEVARDARAAWARLAELDPTAAGAVHAHDHRRVVRALELAEVGETLVPPSSRLWSPDVRRPTLIVGLEVPPSELERRIAERARAMFEAGVVDEVREALHAGVSHTAEAALGLREIAALPADEACALLVRRTCRYAAYQRKWLRRIPNLVPVDGCRPPTEVAASIVALAGAAPR